MNKENNIAPISGEENIKPKADDTKLSPPKKPPKVEDKPFLEFINEHLIPLIRSSLNNKGIEVISLTLSHSIRPVIEDKCWVLYGEIDNSRKFWLCFNTDKITSNKTITLAESGSEPSLIESFLIDERKITLKLILSRLLQRLNGQKWIGPN